MAVVFIESVREVDTVQVLVILIHEHSEML